MLMEKTKGGFISQYDEIMNRVLPVWERRKTGEGGEGEKRKGGRERGELILREGGGALALPSPPHVD